MKQALFILIMFISTCLFAQKRDLKTVKIDSNYTWRNSTLAERESFYFNQPVIGSSHFKIHFRIYLTGQTIDFFSNDNENYKGILTNKITEYKQVEADLLDNSKEYQYLFQKVVIDTDLSSVLAKQILRSGQDTIPTDSLIKSWHKLYLHCGNVEFQFKVDEKYKNQSFHCPWSQPDTTEFVKTVVSNYELIKKELDLESRYDEFKYNLPKGKTYSRDGYRMMYIMSDKENKARKEGKPERDYLKSIKDTIDSYLKTMLDKQVIELGEINCFEDYNIIFNVKGKLDEIQVSEHNKPKVSDGLSFYLEDKREIRKCKKLIKNIFREIDLSSFHLKYKVSRTFSFGYEGDMQLRDNTIY